MLFTAIGIRPSTSAPASTASSEVATGTVADWWNFGINVVIALATLAAVIVAVVSAIRAERATARANQRAEQAQRELTEVQIAAQRDIARESVVRARRDDAKDRASDAAIHVSVLPRTVNPSATGGVFTAPDHIEVLIDNRASTPVTEVTVEFYKRASASVRHEDRPIFSHALDGAVHERSSRRETIALSSEYAALDELGVGLTFVDSSHNRWLLKPSRSLYLRNPRIIDVEPGA